MSCLLYADDLIILAENEVAMQALLKRVCDWCSLWDINVNSNKSTVINFRHLSDSLTTATFTLGELVIPIVHTLV